MKSLTYLTIYFKAHDFHWFEYEEKGGIYRLPTRYCAGSIISDYDRCRLAMQVPQKIYDLLYKKKSLHQLLWATRKKPCRHCTKVVK